MTSPSPSIVRSISVAAADFPCEVSISDRGRGRPYLLLHGGAGPQSVGPFADRFAADHGVRVIAPTHPGFGGTPRPANLDRPAKLAALYVALLEALDLSQVTVVGNSIGGWIAAEMALLASPRIAGFAFVNAVGIIVPEHPVADVAGMALPEIMKLSYFRPDAFRVDPSTFSEAQRAGMAANRAAMAVYSGGGEGDPTLRERLAAVKTPAVVLWGEADRIVDLAYGKAYAAAIPGARFEVLPETGHVPQIETPELLSAALGRL